MILHPALHRILIPVRDENVMPGAIWPVNVVGSPGMLMSHIRLIDLKRHIDYFSKGTKSNRTDYIQKRRSFRVNLIL